MAIPSGTKLGSYEITRAIDTGKMSKAYQAHESHLGRDLAIQRVKRNGAGAIEETLTIANHIAEVLHAARECKADNVLSGPLTDGRSLAFVESPAS